MEKGVFARALTYHWPPNSWDALTIPQLVRMIRVETELAERREEQREEREPTGPPLRADTGSDTADDE